MFETSVNYTAFSAKPPKNMAGFIQSNIELATFDSVEQLAQHIEAGCSFYMAVFQENKPTNNGVISCQLLGLDFDEGTPTAQEFLEEMRSNGLEPNIIYHTFSNSPELEKFRAIWVFDTPFSGEQQTLLLRHLLKEYPATDKACKNPSRMFYGSRAGSVVHCSNKLTDRDAFLAWVESIAHAYDVNTTRLVPKDSYFPKRDGVKPNTTLTRVNFKELASQVRIFREFLEGTRWLTYPELFGLASNLIHIRGGEDLYLTVMDGEGFRYRTQSNYRTVRALPTTLRRYDYFPERLSNFSPYVEDHEHRNLLTAAKGESTHLNPPEVTDMHRQLLNNRIPLERAEMELNEFFGKFLRASVLEDEELTGRNIYIAAVAPGVGKTRAISEMFTSEPCIIAFKRHKLMQEFYWGLSSAAKSHCIMTPQVPTFDDPDLEAHVQRLFTLHLFDNANAAIQSIAKKRKPSKFKGAPISGSDCVKASQYINQNAAIRRNAEGKTILTTHHRLVHSLSTFPDSIDTIVFDEDPFFELHSIDEFDAQDFLVIAEETEPLKREYGKNFADEARRYYHSIRNTIGIKSIEAPVHMTEKKLSQWFETHEQGAQILSFFSASHFMGYINKSGKLAARYITSIPVPAWRHKVLICSATASVEMYKIKYPDLNAIDLKWVKPRGQQLQVLDFNTSERHLQSNPQTSEELDKAIGGAPVITYRGRQRNFSSSVPDVYVWAGEGTNSLDGRDGCVVATPRIPAHDYILIAAALGVTNLNYGQIHDVRPCRVEWNGVQFHLSVHSDPTLQKITLALIDAELVQLSGRYRAIRRDSTVVVYSTVPATNHEVVSDIRNLPVLRPYTSDELLEPEAHDQGTVDITNVMETLGALGASSLKPDSVKCTIQVDESGDEVHYGADDRPLRKYSREGETYIWHQDRWICIADSDGIPY